MVTTPTKLTTSIVLGVVLVPLTAFAAIGLKAGDAPSNPEAAAAAMTTDPQTAQVDESVEQACGPEAALLLERERSGDLTNIERAALDALRPICADEGMPLGDPASSEPVVETRFVAAGAPSNGSAGAVASSSDTHGDDFDDDHDDDDSHHDDFDDDDFDDDDFDDDDDDDSSHHDDDDDDDREDDDDDDEEDED